MKNKPNQLASETSPYLLQHAHNPVNWYPWGEAALSRAHAEDKPILLSIGYAACHWCHVMERESFEDEHIAAAMNADFVCIKVDREERPDLDSVYMAATMAMSQGRGGWPMTVFLAPDGKPFFAGTYFPPEDKQGMPGFPRVLAHIANLWKSQRQVLLDQAAELTQALQQGVPDQTASLSGRAMVRALAHWQSEFDTTYGGFGGAPKFPHATTLTVLLHHDAEFHDEAAQAMALKTLEGMAQGGMYDVIGGGFARYSTDVQWLVPHFEKMLYDNASLAQVYTEAFAMTRDARFAQVACSTLDFVAREMTHTDGGFFTSYDADSHTPEGILEEGAFYVWTFNEVETLLGAEEARRVCAYFDITPHGNWEGHSVANTPHTLAAVAATLGISAEILGESVERARVTMLAHRAKRSPPALDDKILTGWNGLMISAFAVGSRVLQTPRYLTQSLAAAEFVWNTLRAADGNLWRTCRNGRAHLAAFLEDYAYLSLGYIDLYEAGGGLVWLQRAESLAAKILSNFIDPATGAFFDTANHHEELLFRVREGHDGATPNANASAALALARLAVHLDRPAWQQAALRAIEAHGAAMERAPWAFCQALLAWDVATRPATEVVCLGDPSAPNYQTLWASTQQHWVPRAAFVQHNPATNEAVPLAADKRCVDGQPTLYVCRDHQCLPPIVDSAQVNAALAG